MAFQGASSSSSSSFSSSFNRWTYDVFLSFRGEDTRNNFTAHLYDTLRRKGINTYIDDDDLRRGDEISPALLKAIEESKISIIILSKNYASSIWCLDELTRILECKETKQQIVLPVFYDVDPSEVRHHKNSVGKALDKLEDKFKVPRWKTALKEMANLFGFHLGNGFRDNIRVQRWKAALNEVAKLSGFHLENGNEPKFINEIVQEVSRIVNSTYLNVAKYPVGIESRVQDVKFLLNVGMNDIRIVGIVGVGGIGKTTIAKAIYNLITHQFEASCFLANVRETSSRECGLVKLQETLLYEILGDSRSLNVRNDDRGINVIKHRLCSRKVLVIIDDVDQLAQLEKLVGNRDWFGLGSRIIITTRDQNLLTNHEVDSTYEMKKLDQNEARQLFSWNAFKRDKPIDGYVELTEHVIRYAGGLPLALTVLGSDLHGRDVRYWKDALDSYKRIPKKNIQEKLTISYNGLEENDKNIFLDIACFFKGESAEYVIKILDSCGFASYSGIKRLVDKCLITVDGKSGTVLMHDLLQDMGREIVRQESPKEPGRRSRLWFHEDIRHVLEENTGTNTIEGIFIELPERETIRLNSKAFMKMKRLRLFISRNARFSGGLNYLSNELRLLDWNYCPLQSLPSNFHGKKLVVFKMHDSLVKELGVESKNFQNLTIMKFSDCHFLTKIPDLSRNPHLKEMIFYSCTNLVEVHHSVGFLNKLTELSFPGCSNLRSFPRSLKLRSLESLDLRNCSSLQNFPEIECKMECLSYISLDGSGIKELPSSIGNLNGLQNLYLGSCKNLLHVPNSMLQLQNLKRLRLDDCSELVELPKKVRDKRSKFMTSVESTKESEISSHEDAELLLLPSLKDGCCSMVFPALEYLDLENCPISKDIYSVMILNCSSILEYLNLSRSDIVSLPTCIKSFVGLRVIRLKFCKQLEEIQELPPNIEDVYASGCTSLKTFPKVSKNFEFNTSDLRALKLIDLSGCHKMRVNIGNHVSSITPLLGERDLQNLPCGIIFPGNKIPDWFNHCEETSMSNSCEIDINGLWCLDDIRGIVLCAVIRPILSISPKLVLRDIDAAFPQPPDFGVDIIGNDGPRYSSGRSTKLTGSDHVWMEYFILSSFKLKEDNLRVKFYCNSNSAIIKSCGVHLVYKHEENAKDDDLDMLHERDEEIDGIRLAKRRRDDDSPNFVSNWYPQQKRRSSSIKILDLEDTDCR